MQKMIKKLKSIDIRLILGGGEGISLFSRLPRHIECSSIHFILMLLRYVISFNHCIIFG
jgi:hypothetical protein